MGVVTFATPEQLAALKEPRAWVAPKAGQLPLFTAKADPGSLQATYLGLSELAQRSAEPDAATIRGALKWLEHLKYAKSLHLGAFAPETAHL